MFIFFGAVPNLNASDMKMDNMEEIKKKKKKKGKKIKKGWPSPFKKKEK